MTTSIKTCFKCGAAKPLADFYKHSAMKDGHLNKCKDCAKSDVRKYRFENDSVREYDRKRGSRVTAEQTKVYRNTYPNKYKAHSAVNNALRSNKLVKPSACEGCLSCDKLHAHHDDYLLPLIVRWLCAKCHHRWHAANGEAKNA